MGEEFYCVLKLVSGEEIFSLVSVDESEDVVILQSPVIMKAFNNGRGVFIKVKPWIEMSEDNFFIVRLSSIITMTESKEQKLIDIYNNYITDGEDDSVEVYDPKSGKVGVSKEMGYVSSVEESRKILEKLFKDFKES